MFKKIIIYSYLEEVRYRLFYLVFSFSVTYLISYIYSFELIYLLVKTSFAPKSFIFTDLSEALSTTLRICLIISFLLLIPLFFYQCWSFIVPGLFQYERAKFFLILFFFFLSLFIGGTFIFFIVLPKVLYFFFSFELKKNELTIQLEANVQAYLHFILTFFIFLLSLFQIPFICYFLYKFKVLKAKNLSLYRKFFYFFALLTAAFFSPPEFVYQLAIVFLFFFFYEIGIYFGFFYEKKKYLENNLLKKK